jgi:translation initiation factor IF-1
MVRGEDDEKGGNDRDDGNDGRDGKQRPGTVRAILPRALYRVAMDGGHEVIAHAPTGPGRNFVRLIEGDRVIVAPLARDAGRARIVRKVRS